MLKKISLVAATYIFTACGATPDGEISGACALEECSSATILGGDPDKYEITIVGAEDTAEAADDWICAAAGDTFSTTYKYVVRDKTLGQDVDKSGNAVPIAGVNVGFVTSGAISEDDIQNPDQLCSDSCGVVTVQIGLTCPPAGTQSLSTIEAVSGAIGSGSRAVTVTNSGTALTIWEPGVSFKRVR